MGRQVRQAKIETARTRSWNQFSSSGKEKTEVILHMRPGSTKRSPKFVYEGSRLYQWARLEESPFAAWSACRLLASNISAVWMCFSQSCQAYAKARTPSMTQPTSIFLAWTSYGPKSSFGFFKCLRARLSRDSSLAGSRSMTKPDCER